MWRKEIDIMNSYKLDLEKYAALARQAVAEAFMLIRLGKIRSELKNIFVIHYKRT